MSALSPLWSHGVRDGGDQPRLSGAWASRTPGGPPWEGRVYLRWATPVQSHWALGDTWGTCPLVLDAQSSPFPPDFGGLAELTLIAPQTREHISGLEALPSGASLRVGLYAGGCREGRRSIVCAIWALLV